MRVNPKHDGGEKQLEANDTQRQTTVFAHGAAASFEKRLPTKLGPQSQGLTNPYSTQSDVVLPAVRIQASTQVE